MDMDVWKERLYDMKREIFCILVSLFCFGYCYLIYSIKSGTHFYLIWAAGGLFFLGLCAFMHLHLWNKMPTILQKLIIVFFVLGFSLFFFVEGLILTGFRAEGEDDLDYIIVLGAQMKEGGPSAALKFRLDKAYDYLAANENTICIGSGGQGVNEPCSEAQGMYDYLVGRGISGDRILMEDKSTDTSENIAFSAKLLNAESDSVGIVTNNFHVFRGVRLARHQGLENVYGIAARSNVYFQLNNMVREFFGILKDFVFGNLI